MILKKYDLIIDIHCQDDVAIMHETAGGDYVKADDAEDKIQYLVEALLNLKRCNMKLNSTDALNDYVDNTLQGYL